MKKRKLVLLVLCLFVFAGCSQDKADSANEPDIAVADTEDKDSTVVENTGDKEFKNNEVMALVEGSWTSEDDNIDIVISSEESSFSYVSLEESYKYTIVELSKTEELSIRDYDEFDYLITCDCNQDGLLTDIPFSIDGEKLVIDVFGSRYSLVRK